MADTKLNCVSKKTKPDVTQNDNTWWNSYESMSLKLNDEQALLAVNNTKKNCVTKKTKPDVTKFQLQIKTFLLGSMPSLLKYGSQEIIPFWCRCSILLGPTFVEIKNSFTKTLLTFNSKDNFPVLFVNELAIQWKSITGLLELNDIGRGDWGSFVKIY